MLRSAKRDRLRRAGQTDGSRIWYCWPRIRIGSFSFAEGEDVELVVTWLWEKRLNEKRPRTGKYWGLNLKIIFVILKKVDMVIVCFYKSYSGVELNHWHSDFQSNALPSELPEWKFGNRKKAVKIKTKEGENRTPNLGFGGPRFTTKLLPWVKIAIAQNRVERLFSGHEPTVLPVTPPRWTKYPLRELNSCFHRERVLSCH